MNVITKSKRPISLLLIITFLLTLLPTEVSASTGPVWRIEEDCLTVSGEIPDYATFNDDAIPWKNERYHITKLVVEEGVTQIGDYAFNYMPKLTEVSLPSTLKRIGVQGMSAMEVLQQLELPESVEIIGDSAFQGNSPTLTLTVLNRSCQFGYHPFGFHWDNDKGAEALDEQAILRGYIGSTAETYAQETGVQFSAIVQEGWNPSWNIQTEPAEDVASKDSQGRIHLSTPEDLAKIRDDLSGSYILDEDIDASGWEMPYGEFSGILDGNGHTLSGLSLSGQPQLGFFQNLSGIVCNLHFTGVSIATSDPHPRVGVIAAQGGGQILNCSAGGRIHVDASGWAKVGGLTGGSGSFSNCESNVEITVSVDEGCQVGAFSADAANIMDSQCSGTITVRQKGSKSSAQFNVYGIYGMGTTAGCTSNTSLDVDIANGKGYGFGLFNVMDSTNTGQIDVSAESGAATAQGGQNVLKCENSGTVSAQAGGAGSSAAIGMAGAVASNNGGAVSARASGQASAYACGISGVTKESEDNREISNAGTVFAHTEQGTATAMGVDSAKNGGTNSAKVSAESTAGKSVAYGMSSSAYGTNQGAVNASGGSGSGQTALACGLSSCKDSYNSGNVTAVHNGTGQGLAHGCANSTRCENTASVRAQGLRHAGATGLDNCTDSTNSADIYAVSTEGNPALSPSASCYGCRSGSGCVSSGRAEAVGNAFTLNQGDSEGWADYTAVTAGYSAEVAASVKGFYSISCTPGNPVPLYLVIQDGVYLGVATELPTTVPKDTEYVYMKTFSADGNAPTPEPPRKQPSVEMQPNLSIVNLALYSTGKNRERVHAIHIDCGSMSFCTGVVADPSDPSTTDYRQLDLELTLCNTGSGASPSSQVNLTLPEGFSFSPNSVQRTSDLTLPSVQAGGMDLFEVTVYPLYSESYHNGDSLVCEFRKPNGDMSARNIDACQVRMPQNKFNYAQVYYGKAESDPKVLLFKYFEWIAADFLESSDRYHESMMRLSALLSQAIYQYQDGELLLANNMMSALGFSLVSLQGQNTAMGYKRLYAKKTFVVEEKVYELFITSVLGTADIAGWVGNLAFVSVDKYHASFQSIAQEAESDLDAYMKKYSSGAASKCLITGHSRGGASANLLGASLNQRQSLSRNDIFCYTFAAANCVRDDGELADGQFKNIFNIMNFNDVVSYVPGCYGKYGVSMLYQCETDTIASLYIAPIREFSTDELLLGNADALRLEVTLAFLLPQINRIYTKHIMPNYIEDLWAFDPSTDMTLSMEGANFRQDDICRKYIDGFIESGNILKEILGYLQVHRMKDVLNLTKPTKRQKIILEGLEKMRDDLREEDMDAVISPITDEAGRNLIRKGIMQMRSTKNEVGRSMLRTNAADLRCPFDIYVYDSNNALVASIENDRITKQDAKLAILFDESNKLIYFPLEEQYRFETKGCADGEMEVQYYETDDQGKMVRIEHYLNIPVQLNSTCATIQTPTANMTGVSFFMGGETPQDPQTVMTGETVKTYTVSDVSNEDVQVLGCGPYYQGEYTYLTSDYIGEATAVFLGWYIDDQLVSTDYVLSMQIERDLAVEARYELGEPPVLSPGVVSASRSASGVAVTLQGDVIGDVLIAAAYDDTNHRMIGCSMRQLSENDMRVTLSLPGTASEESIRVFLLEGDTYRPLCEPYSVP